MSAIESAKMNKKAFSVVHGFTAEDDREYWWHKTPLERLETLEMMRQIVYGYDPASQRLQRVFAVIRRS